MALKTLAAVFAATLMATTFAFAQSQPNYGANAPATGDSFGKPYSGSQPPKNKRVSRHHRRHHHHHYARRHSQTSDE